MLEKGVRQNIQKILKYPKYLFVLKISKSIFWGAGAGAGAGAGGA